MSIVTTRAAVKSHSQSRGKGRLAYPLRAYRTLSVDAQGVFVTMTQK